MPYTGVYALQLQLDTTNAATTSTTLDVILGDGHYATYTLTAGNWDDGWTSKINGGQDRPMYLKSGTNLIYIKNTGNQAVTIKDFDYCLLNKGGNDSMIFYPLVGKGATIPN